VIWLNGLLLSEDLSVKVPTVILIVLAAQANLRPQHAGQLS
jgi:hypothetical protein